MDISSAEMPTQRLRGSAERKRVVLVRLEVATGSFREVGWNLEERA